MKTAFFVPRRIRLVRGSFALLLMVLGTLALSPISQAALIGTQNVAPGGSVLLTVASGTPGTLVASLLSPYSFTTTAGTTSGTLDTAVFREAGGTLDFYYQVMNNATSATSIRVDSDTAFDGFLTALGYRIDGATLGAGFVNGTVAPFTGDRNLAGQVVGFNFNQTPALNIQPGQTSFVLAVSTNATNFTAGNAEIQDGGNQTVSAFQPAAGVPEPASIALIGGGLLALAGIRRFRRQ